MTIPRAFSLIVVYCLFTLTWIAVTYQDEIIHLVMWGFTSSSIVACGMVVIFVLIAWPFIAFDDWWEDK